MKLNVRERYTLLQSLPATGTLTTIKIVRELREELSFSEEEIEKYEITETPLDNGQVRTSWNNQGEPKDVEIGEKAMDVIVESLKRLDKQELLTQDHLALCEKFLEED